MNSNNNRFGGFNNGDNFDNGRGGGNGNGDFGNNRGGGGGGGGGSGGGACGGVVGGGGFWNQQTNAQFGNRNNNCGDFQNDFGPTNRLMDLDFSRDFCGGNRFNDNGNSSYRTNFNGNGGGNGNANFSGGGNSQDCLVYVRGMPFYCDEMDLYDVSLASTSILWREMILIFFKQIFYLQFFAPIKPTNCKVILNDKGRHSGNAEVYFRSRQDVSLAMQKNRDKMGSRYIELFDANDSRRPRF